jgi:hypothetical protein
MRRKMCSAARRRARQTADIGHAASRSAVLPGLRRAKALEWSMTSENLREYLEAARQRRVHEQDARKQEMAARHEARRRDFEARSEPLNVYVVRVLEEARTERWFMLSNRPVSRHCANQRYTVAGAGSERTQTRHGRRPRFLPPSADRWGLRVRPAVSAVASRGPGKLQSSYRRQMPQPC